MIEKLTRRSKGSGLYPEIGYQIHIRRAAWNYFSKLNELWDQIMSQ